MIKHLMWGSWILVGGIALSGCGHKAQTAGGDPSPSIGSISTISSSSKVGALSTSGHGSTSTSPPSFSTSYVTYHNQIWGYSLAVPHTFTASASPENRDGKSWSFGSVNIVVYGEYSNAMGHSETVASALSTLDHQKHPSYQAHGADWLVVSGTHGSQIFYIKEFIRSTKMDVLSISYSAADKNHWQSMVSVVSRSFNPGSPPSRSTTPR